jgi:hypothetical protein
MAKQLELPGKTLTPINKYILESRSLVFYRLPCAALACCTGGIGSITIS